MKYLLSLITLLLVGCTTVYKVDANGVCRAPNGKIVDVKKVDPDRFFYDGHCSVHQPRRNNLGTVNGGSWWGQKGGTAYGW